MKTLAIVLTIALGTFNGFAAGWRLIGPDSTTWRNIVQMDVSFHAGRAPYVGVGTTHGICVRLGETWNYVLPDQYGNPIPPEDKMYRAVYFSPWNDSVGYASYNFQEMFEPGSFGGRIPNIHLPQWGVPGYMGGGSIGYSPSLSFEFSSHRQNQVYTWIIDLYKSSDGGTSWQPQQNHDSYGALFLSSDQQRDSVLYAGRKLNLQSTFGLYRSTDDGNSWAFVRPLTISAPYPYQRVADLIANGDTLVAATNRFPSSADASCGITVSTDRGISWLEALPGVNVQKITRDQRLPSLWYAACQGGIYRSVNGGVNWQLYADSLPSLNLVDIRKDPFSDTLYVATSDMGVYQVFGVATGVQVKQGQPVSYRLAQNYPNPFNPSTTISFDLPQRSQVLLTVYDVLGRKVATLVDGVREAGRHETVFPAENLASGVYFYRLSAGGFVQTRGMIIQR